MNGRVPSINMTGLDKASINYDPYGSKQEHNYQLFQEEKKGRSHLLAGQGKPVKLIDRTLTLNKLWHSIPRTGQSRDTNFSLSLASIGR